MSLAITWYDNAAFRVVTEEHILWFDPSVNKNSGSPIRTADINERADFVFTTHGDPGHFVNSVEITVRTGARFVGSEDLGRFILANRQLPPGRVISLKFEETKRFAGLEVYLLQFAPENPVLWTGMKGASAGGRKNMVYEPSWESGEQRMRFTTPNIIWYGHRNIGNGLRRSI